MRTRIGLALLSVLAAGHFAHADKHTDLTSVTATEVDWLADTATIAAKIDAGFRIVDLEVASASPLRFDVSYVENSEDYATGWWWYYGLSANDVIDRLQENNARLLDIEPYNTSNGLRFAIVAVPNAGGFSVGATGFYYGYTASAVGDWMSANPEYRVYDVEPYDTGLGTRYAFIFVDNTGENASPYWVLLDATSTAVSDLQSSNNARLVDLEPDSAGRFSVVALPQDGQRTYWYISQVSTSEIQRFTSQLGARIVDLERSYIAPITYYNVLLRRNATNNALAVNDDMRQFLNWSTDSGLLIREPDGTIISDINQRKVFEPASTLKTAYAFHAFNEIVDGNDSLNSMVTVPLDADPDNSCPNWADGTEQLALSATIKSMLEQSNNNRTDAIRARYTAPAIATTSAWIGANIGINHTLGCLCGQTENEVTLEGLFGIHAAAADGRFGEFEDEWFSYHVNSPGSIGGGGYSLQQAINEELPISGLTASEQSSFNSSILCAAKGGSYTCISNDVRTEHRSWGVWTELPYRTACGLEFRGAFIGVWINDHDNKDEVNKALGIGIKELFRKRLRDALATWREYECNETDDNAETSSYAVSGSGGTTVVYTVESSMSLETILVGAEFINGGNSTWAGDILVAVEAPNGEAVELGGYDLSFGHTSIGDFPASWDSVADGNYGYVAFDASALGLVGGLGGSGTWTIRIANGYADSSGSAWAGKVILRGSSYVPEPADFNGDGCVDGADLAQLLGTWGPCKINEECNTELTGDNQVDGADLVVLLGSWGCG